MNAMTHDEKIFTRVESDYKYVESLGHKVLGVFLQGSQNYKLDYDGSDIDTKAILIPSLKDILLNRKPISTTLILPTNEHIDIKDIRLYIDCFKKQNINFLEILFTPYRIINKEYIELFAPMIENNEKIAHYNSYKAIMSMLGCMEEKYARMTHMCPTKKEKIETYGYDNKELHHLLRIKEFLQRYINGISYEKCLISNVPQWLIEVKTKYLYTLKEAELIADENVRVAKEMVKNYMSLNEPFVDKEVEEILDNVMYDILKYSLKSEL